MGKINEYQRKNLASQAVGVAPADRSGEMIGKTISNIGQAVAKREAELDIYDDVQANTTIMQFGLAFQQMGAQAQREMAANPGKYPERIFTGGQALVNEYANSIQDEGVRTKFLQGANTVLKSSVIQAGEWSLAKKKDNATIAAQDAMRIGAIQIGASKNKEELIQNIETTKIMAKDEIPDDVLGAHDKEIFIDKNMPAEIETYFFGQVASDPEGLIKDLDAGEYDKIEYFTSQMGDKFRNMATSKIQANKTLLKEMQTDNYNGLMDEYIRGQLSFDMISAMATSEDAMSSISPSQATRLKTAMVERSENNANKLMKSDASAKQYIDAVYSVFDDKIDRAVALERIVDVYQGGITSTGESEFLSQTKAHMNELATSKVANTVLKATRTIVDTAQTRWAHRGDKDSLAANYVRDMVNKVATGIMPETALLQTMQKMDVDKVLEDNPGLSGSEDPVTDAYNAKAVEMLTANGYTADKKKVEILAAELKARNGRSE